MKLNKTIADRVALLVFAGPCLPLGLAVLAGMASGDHRYLPFWASVAFGWAFGIAATLAGASAFWFAIRK